MSYQEFLNLVENRFGDWNVMRKGMSHQQLQQLLKAMGLKAHGRVPSREELASLVRERGAVLGSVVWFDKDVSEISSLQAVRHRHEHAIVVKDVDASGRNFTVFDSLYDHELHYKAEELGLQQLIVWTVEPEGQDSSAKLDAFLSR
jgi:hypothetical protein